MTGENDWTGELHRAKEAIRDIRDRGMVGGDLISRALGAVLDLVNHSHVHHEAALAALAGGKLEVTLEPDAVGISTSDPARAGSVAELELLRELATTVLDWAAVDQADAAGRRPFESDMVRLADRWRREVRG